MIRVAVLAALLAAPAVAQTSGVDMVIPPGPPFDNAALSIGALTAPYGHALAAIAGWGLLTIVLTILSVIGNPRARTESGMPVRDYGDPFYRRDRAFRNAIETSGPFLAVTLAAILVGASPFWVNLLASVFLAARVITATVHIGTTIEPLRSAFWSLGLVCTLVLGVMALLGAFAL